MSKTSREIFVCASENCSVQWRVENGEHLITIKGDDFEGAKAGLAWAMWAFRDLVEVPSDEASEDGEEKAKAGVGQSKEAPVCAIHNKPMTWLAKYHFWSCREKMEDGSWCRYRPH